MSCYDVRGKRLLILGATKAAYDIVLIAHKMGIVTIVTDDDPNHPARAIADEDYLVSTTDIDGLAGLIKEKCIDGIFCGPSEFNIRNLIRVCEKTGLRCYTDMQHWDICGNKDTFKKYCIEYLVDCPQEYHVNEFSSDEEISNLDYPVIVKPVDRCSSIGITVVESPKTLRKACHDAMEASYCKRIVVEKYIENNGEIFGVRYLLRDGEAYPYLLLDTYVADPVHRISLISAVSLAPSKYMEYYMHNIDQKVRKMLKGMGLKNGTVFFQALPYDGKIYFHEMGYRLSGGLIYKMTEPLMGINDVRMMIRYALGGKMVTKDELEKIDVTFKGKVGAQLMIPLSTGMINKIDGLEKTINHPCVKDFLEYYHEGDIVRDEYIGTLQQLFGRYTLTGASPEELIKAISFIQETVKVWSSKGELMNNMNFDLKRIKYPDVNANC